MLHDRKDDGAPSRVTRIDSATNRSYHNWHVFVRRVRPGQIHGYGVEGPSSHEAGLRFDPAKILLKPFGCGAVVSGSYDRGASKGRGDNASMIWQLLQVGKVRDTPLILVGAMWAELVEWAGKSMLRSDGPLASLEYFTSPI